DPEGSRSGAWRGPGIGARSRVDGGLGKGALEQGLRDPSDCSRSGRRLAGGDTGRLARARAWRPGARRAHGGGRVTRSRSLGSGRRAPGDGPRRQQRGARHPRRGRGRAPPSDTLTNGDDMKIENTRSESSKSEAQKPGPKPHATPERNVARMDVAV